MIRLVAADLHRLELRARMPFRYGIATMTDVPQVIARVTFELPGGRAWGLAADLLPPKWFTKDPQQPLDEEVAAMLGVIRGAIRRAAEVRAATPFAFWREVHTAQGAWAESAGCPPLLAHFGTSFVERALLHAVCRAKETTLSAALRGDLLGLDLAALDPELAGMRPTDFLPARPPERIHSRHTVGLADPITAAEVPSAERLADGLPQTLEEVVAFYGQRHFKLKVNGDAARDRERLARMARILAAAPGGAACSLDGNESFREVAAFRRYFEELRADPALAALWPCLLYVEQPWHRDVALSPALGTLARDWPERPPIIIDESDAGLDDLRVALRLGYAGTSHKNCKGVFKSVVHAGRLARRRAAGLPAVHSGEDLGSVGPISPLQDLAAQAALGITSVERNGHHYFAGLRQFPAALQEHARRYHSDLYVPMDDGVPRLDLRGGELRIGSLNAAPFGVPGAPDLTAIPAETVV